MKFNPNQRYTRWSIRRLSVGVASVVVASGFFVLVGQPSSVRADVVNPTPAQVVPDATSVSEKSDLPVGVLKEAVDTALPSEQVDSAPKANLDAISSPEKADVAAKDQVVAPKEEVQAKPESKKETEDAVKPVTTVSGQDREANEAQPATTPAEVQKGVADNTKDTVDVPAPYLDKANFPGPFTAGVNQVIPYEFFAGDGMLTRLILKASDKAPWSDNGSAKNPALPPVEKLGKGLYFYEVDLAGTQGKSDKELLDLLKQNGTQSYKATIKVYGAKDGKADLSNLVATKDLDVNLNGLTTPAEVQKGVADNTKDTVDVPATYLDKANFPGPFTAGVNQVIPYEFFAGDGMLTRLILKASDKAPWSDNGSAKNPALPPVEKLGKGLYFYEVDLAGTQGKSDKELLDLLKQNGTQSYKATIKVYGAKDGKADLSNLVATKDLNVNLNGLTTPAEVQKGVADNTKDTVDVPATYLDKANFPGPFTAGVNQVIPYEFFAGDGMLTRLILKASDKAPWSDNGSAKNPALPPVENLGKGLYFYEVDLAGTQGKSDKELLDLLKQNGTKSYKATIKVYGAKDGKADLTNLVATKNLDVNLNGLTTPAEVQKGVADNTKDTVDVPATYLDKANFPGPFTAGVNQVIPYEFFAGDGMLTRLILKASDKAPWSDNGSAKNPALPPVEKLGKGLYFYEVDLAGTQGKSDKELLDLLKQNGTQSYKATIKVYGAKDGKADLTNLVATKDLNVNLNGLTTPAEVQKGVADNTKDTVDVPATYLDKANFPGPFTAGVNQVIPYEFFAGDGMLTRLILKASDKAPWSDNGSAKNPALPPVEKLGKGLYFYEVDLAGTQGKSDKELLDLLKQNGTQSYKATIKVYGAKDGKADLSNLVATKNLDVNLNGLTTPAEVQKGVADNTKDTVDVPATYLDKANFPGPFTAGVNQVIPYEFFAGDGMLTRLILKASDKAPWSDNGSAKNPALPPVEKLGKGLYFYEVDLVGTQGKSDKELLDLLKQNGTQSYKATIKVYGVKDGKADLTNLVATKDLDVNLNGLTTPAEVQKGVADNTKDTVDVPASYLDKANFPGPFTAGVNQVIPYELFAGDGMLTRLILKASDKAPWSDNGSAKNPALPPVEKLGKGLYFYEVDLAGTQGKSDKELLDLLKQNGTQSYKATIKVYGAKDGKADLSNLVATKDLTVNLNGLTTPAEVQKGVADNTKDTVDVPATYLDKANFPGPFTAGVNQVIPYEFFAGDGMLTRLILKASDKAPWSDNGSAKNPALPPVEKLGKGLYFYEVDLAGTQGKSDKELLDLLKQNGTQSYKATIKVYGAKDGKADLTNLVATKDLTVNLNGHQSLTPMQSGFVPSSNGSAMPAPMMNSHQDASKMNAQMPSANQDEMKSKMPAASQDKMMPSKEQDKTMNASQPMATPSMKQDQAPATSSKMSDEGKMTSNNKASSPMMAAQMKDQKDMLPYTGEAQTSMATLGFFGLALAGLLGGLGLKAKKEEND